MAVTPQFSVADYAVFAISLLISASIGLYYALTGGKQRTTQEFLMADRKMSAVPVAMSLMASFCSAIALLGQPAEVYRNGSEYWMLGFAYFLMLPPVALLYLPVFYQLKLTSCYEYLELRFSKPVRLVATVMYNIQMVLYMGIVLYAPALALNAVTGVDLWGTVLALGVICTFYTTVGGMKAVIWTDTFQTVIILAGQLAVLIQGSIDVGGFHKVWDIATSGKKVEFFDLDPNPLTRHTFWTLSVGGTVMMMALYAANQATVQRYLSVKSERAAKVTLLVTAPTLLFTLVLSCLIGLVMYARYADCDPKAMGKINSYDQLLPLFVMEIMRFLPGMPGLFVACIFSGALSTISSSLNSLAAVTLEDVIRPFTKNMSETKITWISKGLAMAYGVICIAMAWVASQMGGVLQAALSVFGLVGGPLLGLFSLGMFCPCANAIGAFVGLLSGLAVSLWIGIGAFVSRYTAPAPPAPEVPTSCYGFASNSTVTWSLANQTMQSTVSSLGIGTTATPGNVTAGTETLSVSSIYSLSYLWYSLVGAAVVIIIGLLVSILTGCSRGKRLDPRTISPVCRWMCRCLPEQVAMETERRAEERLQLHENDNNQELPVDVPKEVSESSFAEVETSL
ncbi:SLC5A6 [Branchiostoma lanceolatum]|uniref:SLC5A6 protein n=1 Tax=Branchiostoma lanceolatum TaxID=7740 RepID=A0A8J9ZIK3_BRALA|nr:SLC5A6 [Branchiostoma lanceolatum]